MKRILIKIIKFLDKKFPWWLCCILGILLMIVPPTYAASKGITSLEPGFGVLKFLSYSKNYFTCFVLQIFVVIP